MREVRRNFCEACTGSPRDLKGRSVRANPSDRGIVRGMRGPNEGDLRRGSPPNLSNESRVIADFNLPPKRHDGRGEDRPLTVQVRVEVRHRPDAVKQNDFHAFRRDRHRRLQ